MNTELSTTHSTTEEGKQDRLIQYHKDENLLKAQTQVIVIPVSLQGVMAKGLAGRFPGLFRQYHQDCQSGKLRVGRPTLFTKNTPWILLFPTKDQADSPSKLEYIERSLSYLVANYQGNITSIAFPKIGCEGQLSWEVVGPVLAGALMKMEIPTHVYINNGDAQYQPMSISPISPYQLGDTLPMSEKTLEIILQTTRFMLVCDKRFHPAIYYICLDHCVHATTVQEKWAQLLYKRHQTDYPA